MATSKSSSRQWLSPLDRTALILILVLSLAIGFFLLMGDRAAARVRDFSWQGKQVGAEDAAFLITFSRPMNAASVEQNLRIEPPLAGKFSWAGRRMAYTLESPAPYGQTFQVKLDGARDKFSEADHSKAQMQPFDGQFRTRDRAFVYLGVEGEEAGRLVLQNLTAQTQKLLTPATLTVIDFEPYPEGDRILFSAAEKTGETKGLLDQKLYTVTTGIQIESPATAPGQVERKKEQQPASDRSAGIIAEVLSNQDYQNLKFDLSPDGHTIIVQRVNKEKPSDFGLWQITDNNPPQRLETEPGGDFLIAPDSQSLAMSQGQGMAILPLESGAEPLDFLPKYGVILSFAKDGTAAALIRFNRDPGNPTRSLFLVTNQGNEKELITTDGTVYDCQFAPNKQNLYCLYTRRLPSDIYVEQPYLAAINLETAQLTDLLELPIQQDIQMSLAPDSLGILFDQVISDVDGNAKGTVRGRDGKAIETSRLWFLPIATDEKGLTLRVEPQELGLAGLRPRWLP